MKKASKILLLSLVSLSLVGCNNNTDSTSAKTSEPPISEKASDTPKVSSSKTSTNPVSSDSTSVNPDSSQGGSSSSSATDIYDTTPWKKDIVDLMIDYLGGNILPYVGFRKPTASFIDSANRTTSYLEISSLDSFDETKFTGYQKVFTDAGWSLSSTTSSKATLLKKDQNLKVILGKGGDDSWILDAYYDEPFDATKAPIAWSDEVLNEFDSDFGHNDIPYVYLGRKKPYVHFTSSSKTMNIYGWRYDASILTAAKTAFTAAGWKVVEGNNSSGGTLEATKSYENGDKLTATIEALASTATVRSSMKIVASEEFNPSTATAWPQDVQSEIKNDFHGHDIPFIYLGTKYATVKYDDKYNKLTFTGATWNDAVLTNAKTSFNSAGWTCVDGTNKNGATLTASKDFDDGCTLVAKIETPSYSSTKATMVVQLNPKLVIPEAAKDWDSDTKAVMKEHLYGNILPYIYLGDTDTTASFNNTYARVSITPVTTSTWQNKMIDNAETVLAADGYTNTEGSNSYGKTMRSEKTLDNGDKMVVTMDATSPTSRATLNIWYFEKFDASYATSLTWYSDDDPDVEGDNSTGSSMDTHFDKHKLPFIYLGSKYFNSSYNSSTNTMTVYGNSWNDQIIPLAETNLTNDNAAKAEGDSDWTIKDNAKEATDTTEAVAATTLTAKKTFADGCSLSLKITKPTTPSGTTLNRAATLDIIYQDVYGTTETDWSAAAQSTMKANLGNNTIPFTYLNTDAPVIKKVDSSSAVTTGVYIEGGLWDDRIYSDAKKVYDAAEGWSVMDATPRYDHPALEAYKVNIDGSTLRVAIMKYTRADTAKAYLFAYYDKKVTYSTTTDWTDEEKKKMAEASGTDYIPYLDLDTKTISSESAKGGYTKLVSSKTMKYNFNYFLDYTKKLESEGWTTKLKIIGDSTATNGAIYATTLTAGKTFADNSKVELSMSFSTSTKYTLQIHNYEAFSAPTGDQAAWASDDVTLMKQQLDGFVLPYFYMGSKNPVFATRKSSSTNPYSLSIRGSTWDDAIFTNVITAISKDTTATWSYSYDYSKMEYVGKMLTVTGIITKTVEETNEDTGEVTSKTETHYVTIKIYRDTEANYYRPFAEVSYY